LTYEEDLSYNEATQRINPLLYYYLNSNIKKNISSTLLIDILQNKADALEQKTKH